jgi:hypothetical protein
VSPLFGPHRIFTPYRDGKYPRVTLHEAQAVLEGRSLRLGAYGDPAAIPFDVWRSCWRR